MRRDVAALGLILFLALLMIQPAVAASPTVWVRGTPAKSEVLLSPGTGENVDIAVRVEFRDGACASGASVSVTMVFVDPFPKWAGASINPQTSSYGWPNSTRHTTLGIYTPSDAPRGETATYRIRPDVHQPEAASCPTTPAVDTADFTVKLHIRESTESPAASSPAETHRGSPGPGFLYVILGWCVVAAWSRLGRRP